MMNKILFIHFISKILLLCDFKKTNGLNTLVPKFLLLFVVHKYQLGCSPVLAGVAFDNCIKCGKRLRYESSIFCWPTFDML